MMTLWYFLSMGRRYVKDRQTHVCLLNKLFCCHKITSIYLGSFLFHYCQAVETTVYGGKWCIPTYSDIEVQ